VFIICLKLTIKKYHSENRVDTPKIFVEETIDALISDVMLNVIDVVIMKA